MPCTDGDKCLITNTMDKIVSWNKLPCLLDEETGKAAIFTNIDGKLTICRTDTTELYTEETLRSVEEMGGFKCLKHNVFGLSNEFTLVLSLTERCNARCAYCFLDAQTSGGDMDSELIEKSIDFAIKIGKGRTINFAAFGGEPSLKPNELRHMVDYAKRRYSELGIDCSKMKFSITTNGYFSDDFCDFLIDNGFNISFSMDGIPEVQRHQRQCAVGLQQLEKNLSRLANAGNCVLKVRATVTDYSVGYMLDSVKYLNNLGVKRIHFEPVTLGGRASEEKSSVGRPDAETFSSKLIECIQYGKDNGIDIICFPYMNINNAPIPFCDGSIRNRIVVGPHGVLSTCVEVQDTKHPLFNYLGIGHYDTESKTFKIDFDGRRICHSCSANNKNDECEGCAFKFFCAGGCPTRNYRGTMNSDSISDYRCEIMKKVMPYVLRRFYDNTYNIK